MRRLRFILKKLCISAVSLVLLLAIGEIIARASEPGPFSFFDSRPYVDSSTGGYERHRAGFAGRWDSTWYEIDERGFRGKPRIPTGADGEIRVACVGDSCTFGKGVLESDSWPRQLESLLRAASNDQAMAFNLGINGADGAVYLELLKEHIADLEPQAVVVGYNINDFPNSLRAIDEAVFHESGPRRFIPQKVRDSLGQLALYRKARAIYYDMRLSRDLAASEAMAKQAAEMPVDEAMWEREQGYLREIRDLAAAHGGRVVVFLFPYESQVLLESYDRTPIDRVAGICAELDMPFVDLAEEFRAGARSSDEPVSLFIQGDRYHPNSTGYEIVARRVLAELRELGLVPRVQSSQH